MRDVDDVGARARPRRRAARASAPGRSGTRVSSTSRRPASVSWRRAIDGQQARRRRCRPRAPRPSCRVAAGATWPPSSAATPTAPAPSTTSLQRSSSSDHRLGDRRPRRRPRRRRRSASSSASVRSPGRLTAMPSAIVSAELAAHRLAARAATPGSGAHAATCTPTTSTSGRARLDRDRDAARTARRRRPARRPCARSGTSSSSSSPSEPWPGDDVRVVERVHEGQPASRARSCAAARQSSTDVPPPTWTIAPCAARRLDLGHRRVGGHEDLARHAARPRAARPAPGAWLPAEPATTPRAQPPRRARRAWPARRGP